MTNSIPHSVFNWRGWCPIAAVVAAVSIVTGLLTVIVVIFVAVWQVDNQWATIFNAFADAASNRTATQLQRYFWKLQTAGMVTQIASNEIDFFRQFPLSVPLTVKFLGDMARTSDAHLLLSSVTTTNVSCCLVNCADVSTSSQQEPQSIALGAYSGLAPAMFPDGGPNTVVVQTIDPQKPEINISYADTTTGQTIYMRASPQTFPWMYNFSAEAYSGVFMERMGWCQPFPYNSRAAIGFGGPMRVASSGCESPAAFSFQRSGAVAAMDFGSDAITVLMQSLSFTRHSRLVVFHATGEIYGTSTDDNLTVDVLNKQRLRTIFEISDPFVTLVITAVGSGRLTACNETCSWAVSVDSNGQGVVGNNLPRFTLFSSSVLIVRLIVLHDAFGLDMRALIVIPVSEFTTSFQNGVRNAALAAAGTLIFVSMIAAAVTHGLLGPFRTMTRMLSAALSQLKSEAEAQQQHWDLDTESCLTEVESMLHACHKAHNELLILQSFLPHVVNSRTASFDGDVSPAQHESSAPKNWFSNFPDHVPLTFVALNLHGTHQRLMSGIMPSELAAMHAEYLTLVMDAAAKHGGVVGSFYGDHVFVHFNAQQRVVRHAAAACWMMLDVARSAQGKTLPPVAMAAATGSALAQQMGSVSMRGFHIVGDCVGHATSLLRLTSSIVSLNNQSSLNVSSQNVYHQSLLCCRATVQLACLPTRHNAPLHFVHRLLVPQSCDSPSTCDIYSEPVDISDPSQQSQCCRDLRIYTPSAGYENIQVSSVIPLSRSIQGPQFVVQRIEANNAAVELAARNFIVDDAHLL